MSVKEQLMNIKDSMSFNDQARLSPSPAESSLESRQVNSSRSSPSDGATLTDATSVDEDTIVVQPPILSPIIAKLRKSKGRGQAGPLEQAKADHPVLVSNSEIAKHPGATNQDDTASSLSELGSDMELDDSTMTITAKKGRKRKRRLPRPSTDLDHAPPVRIPGDYVLTPALLAEPASAWINCKICEEPFVQKDAYFTRSSCPRCERHSKLYGYMWPKTDKEGRHDTEERVLDHRTVHRFLRPSEERSIRRRGQSSAGSRAGTREVSEVVPAKEESSPRRRGRAKTKRCTL
jgi:histone-lysine N-methyltransferase SUV420H